MTHKEIYQFFLLNKKLILYLWFFSISIIMFFFILFPEPYSSTVSFYIEKSQQISISENIEDESTLFVQNGVVHQVKSTEMIDFLITKFKLDKKFGFDNELESSYGKVHDKIKNMIKVESQGNGAIYVKVTSRYNELNASIANEIFVKLDSSIKNQFVKSFETKLKIYKEFTDNSSKKANSQYKNLEDILVNFKTCIRENSKPVNQEQIWDINTKLDNILFQIKNEHTKFQNSLENLEIASTLLKDDGLTRIKLINKAFKDNSPKLLITLLKFVCFSLTAFLCVFCLIIGFKTIIIKD